MAGGSLQVRVDVDAEKTSLIFKEARSDVNRRLREALKLAAERVALPAARRAAWSFAVPFLIARATGRSAYITTRGPREKGRIVGLLEFGGTVRTPIEIQKEGVRGLPIGPDLFRASVRGPRRYQPSMRLTEAVQLQVPRTEEVMLEQVMRAFDGLPHTP